MVTLVAANTLLAPLTQLIRPELVNLIQSSYMPTVGSHFYLRLDGV